MNDRNGNSMSHGKTKHTSNSQCEGIRFLISSKSYFCLRACARVLFSGHIWNGEMEGGPPLLFMRLTGAHRRSKGGSGLLAGAHKEPPSSPHWLTRGQLDSSQGLTKGSQGGSRVLTGNRRGNPVPSNGLTNCALDSSRGHTRGPPPASLGLTGGLRARRRSSQREATGSQEELTRGSRALRIWAPRKGSQRTPDFSQGS